MSLEIDRLLIAAMKGYAITVAVETPILCALLSKKHSLRRRVLAGVWLTACSYPFVTLCFPFLFDQETYIWYVITSEVFAPLSECALFWFAYNRKPPASAETVFRDCMAVLAANVASCLVGFLLQWLKVKLY